LDLAFFNILYALKLTT